MKVSVSFLKSNSAKEETIQKLEQTSCDYLHVDLTDGVFAGEKNYEISELTNLLKNCQKPLDVHFMVAHPEEEIQAFLPFPVAFFTLPLEIVKIDWYLQYLKQEKKPVGLAISPDTPISSLEKYLDQVDLVLLMSVYPGYGGQTFLENTIARLQELIQLRKKTHQQFLIEVDGGINEKTIDSVKDQIDIVVSGSYICMSDDYEEKIESLKK